jgi:signal transduction histidine kinase
MCDIYGRAPGPRVPYDEWSAAVCAEDLPAVEATLRRAIAEKGQGSAEYRILLPNGSLRRISAVERVILDERGDVRGVIGVDMDVTERKQAEEALEHVREDEMRFKDEFLSHVSHELRSPLTAIKQFTTILLGGLAGELNKEQREYEEIVLRNIQQLQSMIDDLLEVTRLGTGKLTVEAESVSVANAVADTFNTLQGTARAKGVTLSCELPADLPRAHADQTRLRQILIILLDNAIKFTPEAGAVVVRARPLPEDLRFLLVEVSDTGCGITSEIAERLFERLFQVSERIQTSRKGLGLGLYICKELVTRQGGRIWAKGQPQKGSTFSFTLPVFSLNSSISPLLKNDKWPAESVALVTVETHLRRPWPTSESREEWSREARSLLQRCLRGGVDVVLPTSSSGTDGERLFVAAFADEAGATVLTNRIRGQFERLLELKQTALSLSVSYSMLEPSAGNGGASVESIVATMARNLEASIRSHVSSEGVQHG